MTAPPPAVIWHDLECGTYDADLDLWAALARRADGPVLDVGAGTGRVALHLARAGSPVIALDRDPELIAALAQRAVGLPIETVLADAREFALPEPVALCLVPMQTVQLLGDADGRRRFLACARRALRPRGTLAIAVADALEPFDVSDPARAGLVGPLPDVTEIDGTVYSSLPLAIRADGDGFVLERRRETVSPDGELVSEPDTIRLDAVDPAALEAEADAAGFTVAPRLTVAETPDYAGSTVVVLGG